MLLPFWSDNAAGWFTHVESRFRAKGVMEEWDRFDHNVVALSKKVIQLCFNAVTHPDDDELYSVFKEDLLQQHTLTKYQRIERLLAVGPLGSCHPIQLLAKMMELCPDVEEASCFFVFFFLQQRLAWLRVQLEDHDQNDIRRLATRANCLFVLHGHKHRGAVAVVESQEDEDEAAGINAVRGAISTATAGAAVSGQPASRPEGRHAGQPGREPAAERVQWRAHDA